jgi:hypothetical protein
MKKILYKLYCGFAMLTPFIIFLNFLNKDTNGILMWGFYGIVCALICIATKENK